MALDVDVVAVVMAEVGRWTGGVDTVSAGGGVAPLDRSTTGSPGRWLVAGRLALELRRIGAVAARLRVEGILQDERKWGRQAKLLLPDVELTCPHHRQHIHRKQHERSKVSMADNTLSPKIANPICCKLVLMAGIATAHPRPSETTMVLALQQHT